jgi:exopolysaccharide production protein ExoZ
MYKSLQGTRALAALLVVLFHLGNTIALGKYFGIEAFAIPFKFGSAGVEFFFVLSGFIIFAAHRNDISKPRRLTNYISKRVIRIYPTYWIIFATPPVHSVLNALAYSEEHTAMKQLIAEWVEGGAPSSEQ